MPLDEDADPPTRTELTRQQSAELFARFHDDAAARRASRDAARDGLVHLHLPLVEHCARRFRNRGEPFEDLVQVGTIGLFKADRPVRHRARRGVLDVRDTDHPRRGQAPLPRQGLGDPGAAAAPGAADADRQQRAPSSPSSWAAPPRPRELAEAIDCSVDEILEGLESSNAYSTLSLDAGDSSEDGPGSMLDSIGIDDVGLEHVEVRESLKPLLDQLDPREKKILLLRFFKNMTQSQIAEEIGVSQMHVSRLLSRTLDQLRSSLEELARRSASGRSRAPRCCAGAAGTPASRPRPPRGRRRPGSCRRHEAPRR